MKTRVIIIMKSHPAASYFSKHTHLAKNLQNTANFYIRNLMTGLKKDPADRTDKENEVIQTVIDAIEKYNAHQDEREQTKAITLKRMSIPTADHWMLSYTQLIAVFQWSNNQHYYALPAQATSIKVCLPELEKLFCSIAVL